jgi:hypothetical protein
MNGSFAILIVGGPIVIGSIIAIAFFFDRKRTQALQDVAEEMGLQFEKQADELTREITVRFELFQKGRRQKSSNLIYGETNGTGVWIFDFQYVTGHGKQQRTTYQTAVCFSSPQLAMPRFSLYREGFMSRIGNSVFGMQDIDFDTHPVFSKMYVLKGDSDLEIREAFHEDLLSFFETQDKNLRVEGDGELLLVYRGGRKVKAPAVKEFLIEGFGIFREFQPMA